MTLGAKWIMDDVNSDRKGGQMSLSDGDGRADRYSIAHQVTSLASQMTDGLWQEKKSTRPIANQAGCVVVAISKGRRVNKRRLPGSIFVLRNPNHPRYSLRPWEG